MLARQRDHNARANCRIRTHAPAEVIYLRAGEFYYCGGKAGGVLRWIGWMRSPLCLRPRKVERRLDESSTEFGEEP